MVGFFLARSSQRAERCLSPRTRRRALSLPISYYSSISYSCEKHNILITNNPITTGIVIEPDISCLAAPQIIKQVKRLPGILFLDGFCVMPVL
jgi:hypothetical protein